MEPPTDSTNECDVEEPTVEVPTTPEAPSSSSKHAVSAEPPRWRFVADAKKTSGYSTFDAGRYVQGKNSDELGAKYKAPDISLYKSKGDKSEVGKLQLQLPTDDEDVKYDVEVERLKFPQAENETPSSKEHEVGKLEVKPQKGDEMLVELRTDEDELKENHQESNSIGDASAWTASTPEQNEEEPTNEKSMEDETNIENPRTLHNKGVDESVMDDNSAKETDPRKRNRILYFLLLFLLVFVVILGVLLVKKNNAAEAYTDPNNSAANLDVQDPVAIVQSTKIPTAYPSMVPSLTLVASSYPTMVLTNEPSVVPSIAPSEECSVGTKSFSIEHPYKSKSTISVSSESLHHATWILKNACTGEIIVQCRPCSLGSLSLGSLLLPNSLSNPQVDSRMPFHRNAQQLLQNITECLPADDQYVFVVQPIDFSDLCCGFDPNAFIISYDNIVVATEVVDDDNGSRVYFGENEATCKSEAPSSSPTIGLSLEPSFMPSEKGSNFPSHSPSRIPTKSPITDPPTTDPSIKPVTLSPSRAPTPSPSMNPISPTTSPTHFIDPTHNPSFTPSAEPTTTRPTTSPLALLGACPDAYAPTSTYRLGASVESNGMVYQCVSVSCRSYGLEPGRNWEVVGYCSNPTSSPTTKPSESPHGKPTMSPSKVPTDPPSFLPTKKPSTSPIKQPSASPAASPSKAPTSPTVSPSEAPSSLPTTSPFKDPTAQPSETPSKSSSTSPIRQPSSSPSKRPSSSPNKHPSFSPIRRPTMNPSKEPSYQPSYSPSQRPTKQPSKTPTNQPSNPPSRRPTINPSISPTNKPTETPSTRPTPQPTLPPTNRPTAEPTCSAEQEAFNVCLAIDMTGSICNGPTGALCIGCDSLCRDSNVPWNSCCSNFADVKDFSAAIVNSLGRLPVVRNVAVVGFAADARLATGLTSTAQASLTINNLAYSGGLGDHASAIQLCQSTLSSSPISKRIIMLITDGAQGTPENVPENAAELAATNAKNAGILIIPVLIPPDAPDTNEASIPFMIDISSDGQYFDVPDYGRTSMLQVQERLVEHISCSSGQNG